MTKKKETKTRKSIRKENSNEKSQSKIIFKDKPETQTTVKKILNPLMQKWFFSKFKSFSLPQLYAVNEIHARKNVLVSAPTGATKTLTAFIAILNELTDSAMKSLLEDKVYCVYISPLKALNRDIQKNLIDPLSEIEEIHGESLGIRIATRTGDTTQSEKTKMLKNPPHILITTPESLAIVLSSIKFKEHLKEVQWMIIDEIHALAENKRGVHLNLSMERLDHYSSHLCRIGLSATVAPLEEVAKYLVGIDRECQVVNVQHIKKNDIKVISPVNDFINVTHEQMHKRLYKLIDKLIQQHKSTLIFTNTRAATERVVDHLKTKFPSNYNSNNIGAHHGSLSAEHRTNLEHQLKQGNMKVAVCSTSLELGIDIGAIDLVICLGSPKSVARALQRIGRAGHQLNSVTKGRIIVLDRDDLVECSVLVKSALEKKIDRLHFPKNALDVLAQQIFGMALDQVWEEKELYKLLKKTYCYSELKRSEFEEILAYLAGEFVSLQERHVYAKIWRKEGKIGKRGRLSRVIYMTNIGTIPDQTGVKVKVGNVIVGSIDEMFLERLKPGDIFVLGGNCYEFRHARGMTANVKSAIARPPTVPSWVSEMLPLSFDLAMEISKFRRLMKEKFDSFESSKDNNNKTNKGTKKIKNSEKKEVIKFIHDYLYLDNNSAEAIYQYFYEQYYYVNEIPNDKLILVENYRDEHGNKQIIFHTLFGRRVNDVLSRAIAYAIGKSKHKDVEIGINDNGFYLGVSKEVSLGKSIQLIKADELRNLMEIAIENSEVLRRRFRHCAGRAMMILRNYMGKKKRVGRQQVSSMILLSAVKRISNDFSILKEARREVLEDQMDIDHAKLIFERIEQGKIKVKEINTDIPSPFAFKISLQGVMDIVKMEDRMQFLQRMHQMVMAKIALKEGKKLGKGKLSNVKDRLKETTFDYKEEWKKQELKQIQEKDEELEELKIQILNLKKIPMFAKNEIVKLVQDSKNVRLDVIQEIKKRKSYIEKHWPKKLREMVLEKIKDY